MHEKKALPFRIQLHAGLSENAKDFLT